MNDEATTAAIPASVESVIAKAMLLIGALDESCKELAIVPFAEATAALRTEIERLAAQAAAPEPNSDLPTYTDDLELRYVEACEERDHLRAVLGALSSAQAERAPVAQAWRAGDAVLRKHVLLMLDGMGEQANAIPPTPGNMVLQKGMRMAIGTAIDRVKSLPGADESRTFMGEPVASPRPVGFVVLNHFGPNKHLFSSFYDTRNSEHEWAPVFADRAAPQLTEPEIKALTAMVWGAPCGGRDLAIVTSAVRAMEALRFGERPIDPANGGRLLDVDACVVEPAAPLGQSQPLQTWPAVAVEGEFIVVRASIDALENGIRNSQYGQGYAAHYGKEITITDAHGFAKDVASWMCEEREDGSSLVTDLLDKAAEKAVEQGSEFVGE